MTLSGIYGIWRVCLFERDMGEAVMERQRWSDNAMLCCQGCHVIDWGLSYVVCVWGGGGGGGGGGENAFNLMIKFISCAPFNSARNTCIYDSFITPPPPPPNDVQLNKFGLLIRNKST